VFVIVIQYILYMTNYSQREDITNKKFGRLTAIRPIDKRNRTWRWECKCDCGNLTIGIISKLKNGCKTSCGCKRKENIKPKYNKNHHSWNGYESISGSYWKSIQHRAKLANLEFNLTMQEIWDLYIKQNKICALSGVEIHFNGENKSIRKHTQTASLDRIDPKKGYVSGNVQWIHKDINYMKTDFQEPEFIEWCRKIYEHKKNKYESTVEDHI